MPLFLTAILVFASTLQAQSKTSVACTEQKAIRAEEEASVLHTWTEVYKSYQNYGECDDGAIAEGYSDSIAHLLSDNWNRISELNRFHFE
jgi:hypothetical protein